MDNLTAPQVEVDLAIFKGTAVAVDTRTVLTVLMAILMNDPTTTTVVTGTLRGILMDLDLRVPRLTTVTRIFWLWRCLQEFVYGGDHRIMVIW